MNNQPKPDSKKYTDLISEIQKGQIKIPKFQRDFVWSLKETAKLFFIYLILSNLMYLCVICV